MGDRVPFRSGGAPAKTMRLRELREAVFRSGIARRALRPLVSKGRLPGPVWKRLPALPQFELDLPTTSFRYRSEAGVFYDRALCWNGPGALEPETVEAFVECCSPARTVVDVGAHSGIYSLIACAVSQAEVIAFEPVPRVFRRLEANVSLNGWAGRCVLREEAVSDQCNSVFFDVPISSNPTSGRLLGVPSPPIADRTERIRVNAVTLDEACAGRPVDLVKIDVEGAEAKVLRGARHVIEEHRPTIVIECLPEGPWREIESMLRSLAYEFHHLRDIGKVPTRTLYPDSTRRWRNFLCTPAA
jgi:FkbM family methyltransferase